MSGKRSAEAHDRYAPADSKKPRFDYRNPSTLAPDAPDEDAILELDEIGKAGQQTKRNAVKLDGYDSDSSTENFDARAEEKASLAKHAGTANGKSVDEDESDMFADLDAGTAGTGGAGDGGDDEELSREGKKKGKEVRFMDVADIEGQVRSSKAGGHVSADFTLATGKGKGKASIDRDAESSSESGSDSERDRLDPEDEDAEELGAGSKKRHAPRLDAFHMQQEGEDGRFDESGNYIRKAADPDAVHDVWLDGLNKKDMKKAREAQEARERERREKLAADDAVLSSDLLSTLIQHLDKGESVLEALQRLNSQRKKEKKAPKWQQKKKMKKKQAASADGDDMDVDGEEKNEDPAEARRRAAVEAITGAADQLFSRGDQDIYDQEREMLLRQYRRDTGEDWVAPTSTEQGAGIEDAADGTWEYRWSDARDGGDAHGPYDSQTMRAWNEAGYFGEAVEFRRVGGNEWIRSVDFR
ncbi:hypothetical protein MBLNU459_g5362t1 [Dothideomycetes sp. NU459]